MMMPLHQPWRQLEPRLWLARKNWLHLPATDTWAPRRMGPHVSGSNCTCSTAPDPCPSLPGRERRSARRRKKPLPCCCRTVLPISPGGKYQARENKRNPGSGPCINTRTPPTAQEPQNRAGAFPGFSLPGLGVFPIRAAVSCLVSQSGFVLVPIRLVDRSRPVAGRLAFLRRWDWEGERAEALGCDGIRGRGNAEVVGAAGHRCRSLIRPRRRSAFWDATPTRRHAAQQIEESGWWRRCQARRRSRRPRG